MSFFTTSRENYINERDKPEKNYKESLLKYQNDNPDLVVWVISDSCITDCCDILAIYTDEKKVEKIKTDLTGRPRVERVLLKELSLRELKIIDNFRNDKYITKISGVLDSTGPIGPTGPTGQTGTTNCILQ